MRIALVSEGTYPYVTGGVSVWCDQLIRGLPEHRWEMVALSVDGSERPLWPAPPNLDRLTPLPLWGARPATRPGAPGADFRAAYAAFLSAVLSPLEPRPVQAEARRNRFLLALRQMHEYAATGGDLTGALTSNTALTMTLDAWHALHIDSDERITLGDAVGALWLLEHMLRPLSAPPVRADLVHAAMNGLSVLVAMTARWRYGTPSVMSEHGMYLRERYLGFLDEDAPHAVKVLVLSFFRELTGAGYLMVDTLAPHSVYNRRWQLRNGADPDRMSTVYNGIDADRFRPAATEPAAPTIVFLGRIDPLKDLHTLIRAFSIVRAKIPDARLRMFGEAPADGLEYLDSCRKLIAELGLTGAATLEGRAGDPAQAYHDGSIVALTSISEGFPYTVVEAMACGRPVVATNVGGVSEAVDRTGMVVPPRDPAAVARACVHLLRDHQLRARLGADARARVLEHFTVDQSLDAYRRIYRDTLLAAGR
ncbi:GT4 family glycosyltransferase PelF [Polymorphospora sp. NPDC051019]